MQKILIEKSTTPCSVNHVFVVDVSGSMYDSLPKMRQHLKNNITTMVDENDTLSIIYFSSRGQHGVVLEAVSVHNVNELENIKKSIDRYLKPMGCTGFVGPIEDSINVVKNIKNNNINNFIFMSDGYDNEHNRKDIINACSKLPNYFDNISFIEYGYYCDRELISNMAEISGGVHIFSEDYKTYETDFEKTVKENGSKKQLIEVSGKYVVYTKGDNIVKMLSNEGKVLVPQDIDYVITFNDDEDFSSFDEDTQYIVLYTSLLGSDVQLAWKILKNIGDVAIVKKLSSCFSKQDFSELQLFVKSMVFDKSLRYSDGKDLNAVPDENAFTIIDLLDTLNKGDNYIALDDEDFNYSRIGKAARQETLNEKIDKLIKEMQDTTDADERKIIAEKISNAQASVEFTSTSKVASVNNIVFNEERANISINTVLQGHVTLPANKATEFNIPQQIPTFIYRNYTMVKDGIKNMKILPTYLDKDTYTVLKDYIINAGVAYDRNVVYKINLIDVPLINMGMIKNVSANQFFISNFELLKLQAKVKVYKHYMSKKLTKVQAGLSEQYGVDAALYLESIGVKDGGFSPKVISEKGDDIYMAKLLKVKISGASSLPAVEATITKKDSGKKINLADTLILEAVDEHNRNIAVVSALNDNESIKNYYEAIIKQINKDIRQLRKALNSIMYSILIGKVWFKEFSSYDENSMDFNYNGISYTVSAVLEEKEVSL